MSQNLLVLNTDKITKGFQLSIRTSSPQEFQYQWAGHQLMFVDSCVVHAQHNRHPQLHCKTCTPVHVSLLPTLQTYSELSVFLLELTSGIKDTLHGQEILRYHGNYFYVLPAGSIDRHCHENSSF